LGLLIDLQLQVLWVFEIVVCRLQFSIVRVDSF
jgi:hypothetical protein